MAAIDPVLARGVKLLLSDEPDAADQLRAMLDEALRNKYGVGMKLPAKIPIEEPYDDRSCDSHLNAASPSPPVPIMSEESSGSGASADVDDSFTMNFTELSCVVCGQFNVGVCNQLMECNVCQQLYHQDCHNPPVKELVGANLTWDCGNCSKKNQPKTKIESPISGGKPASFANLKGSGSSSSHKSSSKSSSSSGSSSSHKSSKSSSHSSHSSSHGHGVKRHSTSSASSSSHKSSHHKSSRHSK